MSDKLRVAMVTNYPSDPSRVAGGIQAVSCQLVAELSTMAEVDLHVVHCHCDVSASETLYRDGVSYHYLAQSRRRIVPNMLRGVRQIAGRLRTIEPDVVHAHGPSFTVAALRAGYSPLWTIHGVLRLEAVNYRGAFNRLSFLLAAHYERLALASARFISSVSPFVAELYRMRTTTPIAVVDNPAPPDCFSLQRCPIGGRVLMPAAVIPLKDPLTLVKAAADLCPTDSELQIRLAGSLGDGVYVRSLRAEIMRLGLTGRVELLGLLDRANMMQEYALAEIVVLPSRQEIAPMAIIEAMAAGIPVVASDVGGVPALVQDGVTGLLFPPGDTDALASALRSLRGDRNGAETMGMAGRKQALQRFQRRAVVARYLELYREVAGART